MKRLKIHKVTQVTKNKMRPSVKEVFHSRLQKPKGMYLF